MDTNEALNAAVKLLGGDRGRALLGCDWGTTVSLPEDREVCGNQAVRMVVVHGPGDTTHTLKVCERHEAVIERQTDPHQESSEAL